MKKFLLFASISLAIVSLSSCSGKFDPVEDPEGSAEFLFKMAEDSIPLQETKLFGTLPSMNDQRRYLQQDTASRLIKQYYEERFIRLLTEKTGLSKEEAAERLLALYMQRETHNIYAHRDVEYDREAADIAIKSDPLYDLMIEYDNSPDERYQEYVDSLFMLKMEKELSKLDTIVPIKYEKKWITSCKAVLKPTHIAISLEMSPQWQRLVENNRDWSNPKDKLNVYGLNEKGEVIEEVVVGIKLDRKYRSKDWTCEIGIPSNPNIARLYLTREQPDVKGEVVPEEVEWTVDIPAELGKATCTVNTKTRKGILKIFPTPETEKDFGGTFLFYMRIDEDPFFSDNGGATILRAHWNSKNKCYEKQFTVPDERRKGKHKIWIGDGRCA